MTFDGTMLTPAEVKDLVALDQHARACRDVELGNETSYGYQYRDGYTSSSSYKERARVYAVRVKEAAEALNPHGIGVLAQAEDGGSGSADLGAGDVRVGARTCRSTSPAGRSTRTPNQSHRRTQHRHATGVPKMRTDGRRPRRPRATPRRRSTITEWGVPERRRGCRSSNGTSLTSAEAAQIVRNDAAAASSPRPRSATRSQSLLVYQVRDQRRPRVSDDYEDYFGALTRNDGSKGPFTTAIEQLMRE